MDINIEMFPVVGSVSCVKRFTALSRNVAKVSLMTKILKLKYGNG
jgi:hypothetical protein